MKQAGYAVSLVNSVCLDTSRSRLPDGSKLLVMCALNLEDAAAADGEQHIETHATRPKTGNALTRKQPVYVNL